MECYLFPAFFQEVLTALEQFACYHHIWRREREEAIRDFMKGSPLLSEFESRILYYRHLESKINSEPEYICVGALALYTGKVIKMFKYLLNCHILL